MSAVMMVVVRVVVVRVVMAMMSACKHDDENEDGLSSAQRSNRVRVLFVEEKFVCLRFVILPRLPCLSACKKSKRHAR